MVMPNMGVMARNMTKIWGWLYGFFIVILLDRYAR